jgi:CheY-like chemotaxis protein/tetratricopeptide (TPR) repeat protein
VELHHREVPLQIGGRGASIRLARRILIIDDSEAIHTDFRRILSSKKSEEQSELELLEGALFGEAPTEARPAEPELEVDSAFQGQEGLAKVQQAQAEGRPYSLVFLDYRMPPGWNGAETLRQLRKVAPLLQVVIFSAYSDCSWEEILQEFGRSRLLLELPKPFNGPQLRQLVRSLTEPLDTLPSSPASVDLARQGDRVDGRFELRDRVGIGGMGEVFQALDTATGRVVALKLLRKASAADRHRFEREARALSELHHPAIVRPVAHGVTAGGEPYLAMEWLEGEDLASLLLRRRISVDEALSLALRVASALGEAHGRGMIHRDIKPANLFLEHGEVGQAKLLDFGIARLAGQQRMTLTGALLGTPGYMAPEQARGDAVLTPALDIFALGCVLFEALTGRPAFEGQNMMAVLAKIIFTEAPPLEVYRPDAPPELVKLVSRMLAKEPSERPRDGAALLVELEALAAGRAPSSPSPHSAPLPNALTGAEQRMVSVVMIGRDERAEEAAEGDRSVLADVRSVAEQEGHSLERLVDGSIAAVFGGLGNAKDQVTLAARFALALRARHAGLPISLASARGTMRKAASLGFAIERAAQRLEQQDRARAGSPLPVAIDDTTAALLDPRFEWREGAAGPELWDERDHADTTRTVLGKPTPCVGREIELRVLEQAFDVCVDEPSTQVFLVTAPAGMGKSRLVHELVRSLRRRAPDAAFWFGRADSARADSSLHLLGSALRSALKLQGSEPLEAWHEKLRLRFAGYGTPVDRQRLCEFLGELVGAPFPAPGSAQLVAARQDAQLMAEQLQRAFEDFLRAESAARPVVLILDDLHWGDAASVRFVDVALRAAQDRPVLVLGLARPEVHTRFPRLWDGRGVQEIRLRALSRRASERLVHTVLGEELAGEELERFVSQAEGNAFYLEELIRARAEGMRSLPETVVAMVQSRLAGFESDARRVLRAASIFGEVFWKEAIITLLGGMRASHATDWLLHLVQREVLVCHPQSRFPGEEELAFQHALLREGAYAMLTQEDRTLGHRLAGEWLDQRGESDALVLAEHFERGGALDRAVHHYVRAADNASEADDAEALLSCVERGLRCEPQGEPRGALLSLEAAVHLAREQYDDSIALAAEALELLPTGSRRWWMTFHHLLQAVALSRPAAFMEWARRFLDVPPLPETRAEYIRAGTWLFVSLELSGAREAAYGLLARVRAEGAHLDARDVSSRAYLASCEASHHHLGEEAPWSCMQAYAEAERGFEQAGSWLYRCIVGSYHGKALMDLGDLASAEAVLRENLAMAERLGKAMALSYARLYLARLLAQVAPLDRLEEPEQLARAVTAGKNVSLLGMAHGVLARLALRRGALELAEAESSTACERGRAFPAYSWDVVALRVRILLALGHTAEALGTGEEALQWFEHIGLAGYGELDLRLSVAEARDAAGHPEAAREQLRGALPRLRRCVENIPDAAARERYLVEVPTCARLLSLAREWLGPEALGAAGLESPGSAGPAKA